jgi:hypothetical protein
VFADLTTHRLAGDPAIGRCKPYPAWVRYWPRSWSPRSAGLTDSPARAAACWAGLTPRHHESDTTVGRGHISEQGSRLVRWAAIEAVQHPPVESAHARRRAAGVSITIVVSARSCVVMTPGPAAHGTWRGRPACLTPLPTLLRHSMPSRRGEEKTDSPPPGPAGDLGTGARNRPCPAPPSDRPTQQTRSSAFPPP